MKLNLMILQKKCSADFIHKLLNFSERYLSYGERLEIEYQLEISTVTVVFQNNYFIFVNQMALIMLLFELVL